MDDKLKAIEIGFQLFLEEGGKDFGAVRAVAPGGRPEIVVYIENGGNFIVPIEAVRSARDQKVILDPSKLDGRLRDAVKHAHDREVPGL
jgi:hypothetical protein